MTHEHRYRVEQTQPLERAQAEALCLHLILNFHAEPLLLALRGAEGPDQADVAHDVGEIAAHVRGMTGETLVKLTTVRCQPRDDGAQYGDHHEQYRGQIPVDGAEHDNARNHRRARRNRRPHERVFDRPRRIRRRGDAPGERAGKLFDEVARTLPGQMVEQVQPHVAAHGDERVRRSPAADAP